MTWTKALLYFVVPPICLGAVLFDLYVSEGLASLARVLLCFLVIGVFVFVITRRSAT